MSTAQKISQLTTAGPLTGAELVPIVQTSGTLQTTVSTIAAFAVVSIVPVVSALGTEIAQVSAIAAANTTAITSVQADVSALTIRTASVSAVTSVNSAAITSINNVVSALDVRVSVLEVAVSNIGDVSTIAALVSTVTSLETVVSALVIQTAAVSALTSVNSAAITSINDTVSALEVRVSTVSAAVSALQIQVASVSANTSVNSAAITSINAVVSTKVNRNGDFLTNVQYIEFNTTTSFAFAAGHMTWDIDLGTIDLGLTGTVNLPVGQRQVIKVFNNGAVTLPINKVVRLNGAANGRPTAALAQADSDANSHNTIGVMVQTVSASSTGYAATSGVIRGFDTSAYADGATLWLSPVSAGEMTATKPTALTGRAVQIGVVVKSSPFGSAPGSLVLNVRPGLDLNELHNVYVSTTASLAGGEVLAWNTSASVWTNSTVVLDVQASVSALNIQVAAVSALTSVNAAAIAAVSALTSVNAVAIAAVSAAVSTLQVQVNTVSAAVSAALVSVSQRVLKAGDTMSGELNNQDNLVTRPKFKDYSLQAVVKTSVSATTTLDLTEGNFFTVLAGGSTTYVFANPPVSSANGPAAGGFVLELQNGGAATVTWPSTVDWPGGTAPTLTTSGYDVIVCITDDGGTNWRCVQSMKDSK